MLSPYAVEYEQIKMDCGYLRYAVQLLNSPMSRDFYFGSGEDFVLKFISECCSDSANQVWRCSVCGRGGGYWKSVIVISFTLPLFSLRSELLTSGFFEVCRSLVDNGTTSQSVGRQRQHVRKASFV